MVVALYELKRGDHIYSACAGGSYYHHGIYVGKAKVNNPNTGQDQKLKHAVIHFIGYEGDGKKLKSCSPCKTCFYKNQDGIVLTCIDCFTGGNTNNNLYRYEYDVSYVCFNFKASGSCSTLRCSDPDTVIKRAYGYLGTTKFGEYYLLFNNCEHFATKCKTGIAICNQALFGTGLPGAIAYNVVREVGKGFFSWS